MKLLKTISIFLIIISISCRSSDKALMLSSSNNENIIYEVIDKYKSTKKVSYDLNYHFKSFLDDSIITHKAKTYLLRIPKDTLFGARFISTAIVSDGDKAIFGYDIKDFYLINVKEEKASKFRTTYEAKLFANGSAISAIIQSYFTDIESLEKKIKNPKNKLVYEFFDDHTNLSILYPDDEDGEFYDRKLKLRINNKTKLIENESYEVHHFDMKQYEEWEFNNIELEGFDEDFIDSEIERCLNIYKLQEVISLD